MKRDFLILQISNEHQGDWAKTKRDVEALNKREANGDIKRWKFIQAQTRLTEIQVMAFLFWKTQNIARKSSHYSITGCIKGET